MKNCIPSHLFVDIWLQKLSNCHVSLSDWLTTIFVNPWKNQKYFFFINLFTSLLQMKLFLRNNIIFTMEIISMLSLKSVLQKSRFHAQYSSCDCAAAFRSSCSEGLRKVLITICWEKPFKILGYRPTTLIKINLFRGIFQ